jgi:hypothetical protein
MWDLLSNRKKECSRFQDLLEVAAAAHPHVESIEVILGVLPAEERAHFAACRGCGEAGQDLLATRRLFRGVASTARKAGPWFPRRVMASIAARERELALHVSPWSAVPRFASRLSWMTAIVLLAGSTWLFERPVSAPTKQASAATTQEYLFESPPPPMNQDDVLMSMAEKNP